MYFFYYDKDLFNEQNKLDGVDTGIKIKGVMECIIFCFISYYHNLTGSDGIFKCCALSRMGHVIECRL